MKKFFIISVAFFLFSAFFSVAAAAPTTVKLPNPLVGGLDEKISDVTEQSAADAPGFVQDRLLKIVSIMFRILAMGALVPVAIGGTQLIISQGGSYAEKGRKTLYWGVVGLVVAFSGILVFDFILGALTGQDVFNEEQQIQNDEDFQETLRRSVTLPYLNEDELKIDPELLEFKEPEPKTEAEKKAQEEADKKFEEEQRQIQLRNSLQLRPGF